LRAHRPHHPACLVDARIDFQDILAEHLFGGKAEIAPGAVIIKGDGAAPIDCNNNVKTTLDELLKVLYR
jgi:hypothetical protein